MSTSVKNEHGDTSKQKISNGMKILLTGGSGLLGSEIVRQAKEKDSVILAPRHKELDITDKENVARYIKKHAVDCVINSAAQVNVDVCEANPEACYLLNRDGVKNILEAIKQNKKPVIFVQISSSEVFGRVHEGEYKIEGYTEDDFPMPASVYQKSKAEAEEITEEFCKKNPKIFPKYYIARVGWLFGKGRPTFVERFAKDLLLGGLVEAVKDQWRSPTATKDVALSLFSLVVGHYESGVYHLAGEVKSGEVTTPQVIEEIRKLLGDKAKKATVKLVRRDEVFKVPRAPSNVLKNTKLPKLPYWRDALRDYMQEK